MIIYRDGSIVIEWIDLYGRSVLSKPPEVNRIELEKATLKYESSRLARFRLEHFCTLAPKGASFL